MTRTHFTLAARRTGVVFAGAIVLFGSGACTLLSGSESDYFSARPDTGTPSNETGADAPFDGAGDTTTPPSDTNVAGDTTLDAPAEVADVSGDADWGPTAELRIHYKFDDAAGSSTAIDDSSHGFDGILQGTPLPAFDVGHIGGGLRLDGEHQQYVQLPGDVMVGLGSMSVACWINMISNRPWDRLFDFNQGHNNWVYFSPTGWNFDTATVGTHFAMSNGVSIQPNPELMMNEIIATGAWHHVAIVVSKPYLAYYVDGVQKKLYTNLTMSPSDIGSTSHNWIGKSFAWDATPPDPYLAATIDDFRLYSGALRPEEVATLAGM